MASIHCLACELLNRNIEPATELIKTSKPPENIPNERRVFVKGKNKKEHDSNNLSTCIHNADEKR